MPQAKKNVISKDQKFNSFNKHLYFQFDIKLEIQIIILLLVHYINNIIQMSLKVNIETAINISYIKLKQFHKIGWMQYRMHIYYKINNLKTKIYFVPYAIAQQTDYQAYIDQNTNYVFSKRIPIQYINENIQENTTYHFKVYLETSLLENIQIFISCDLLYSQTQKGINDVIYSFQANLNKFTGVFTYLPISFDQFECFCLCGSYVSALIEYKFLKNEDDEQYLLHKYDDFQSYFSNLTIGYRYSQVQNFYRYYRNCMESQLIFLQNQLSKVNQQCLQNKNMKFNKVTTNSKVNNFLNQMYRKDFVGLNEEKKSQLIDLILQDYLKIKVLIYFAWSNLNEFIRQNSTQITNNLKIKYDDQAKQRFKSNIFSHRIKNHDWTFARYNDRGKSHIEQAYFVRKKGESEKQLWNLIFPIENNKFFGYTQKSIKIFEQIYETGSLMTCSNLIQFDHIIILVHGFQATKNDLIPLKQCLQSHHNVKVYISISNIGKTHESIENMGKRLAIEVSKYLEIFKRSFRVSFIGHSMGGLIIRSAVPYMMHLQQYFYSFTSFSTPHLGYLYNPSKIVKAGLWLLNNWQKCQSIIQISMQDKQNYRECFLYKLAKNNCLQYFKKISFIGSCQDQYVPFESARIQKNVQILTQKLEGTIESQVICEMVDNILCEIDVNQFSRLNIIFNIEDKSLDSLIGRTAHIRFISDPHFIRQFVISLQKLFN